MSLQEQVEEIIARLDLRGEDGEDGKDGVDGIPGPPGESVTVADVMENLRKPLTAAIRKAVSEEVAKLESGLEEKIAGMMGDHKQDVIDDVTAIVSQLEGKMTPGLTEEDVDSILNKEVNPHLRTLAGSVASVQQTIIELEARLSRPVENARRHFVLVMPSDATYAPRMTDSYERASENFAPIRLLEPVGYHGELPALVAYEDRIPVASWTGTASVEDMLSRISRGEAETLFP